MYEPQLASGRLIKHPHRFVAGIVLGVVSLMWGVALIVRASPPLWIFWLPTLFFAFLAFVHGIYRRNYEMLAGLIVGTLLASLCCGFVFFLVCSMPPGR